MEFKPSLDHDLHICLLLSWGRLIASTRAISQQPIYWEECSASLQILVELSFEKS